MKTLETIKLHPAVNELRSRRFHNSSSRNVAPTLVIGDTISSNTKLFIAKTRSEFGGLDALLKTLTGSALK